MKRVKVMYISNEIWQKFHRGIIYDADLEYYMDGGEAWFVFVEKSPFHHMVEINKTGYVVNEHKNSFIVLDE